MEETGITEQIQEPTDLVCRYCDSTRERRWAADLHWLQKAEHSDQVWKYVILTVEDIVHKLKGSTIFTKLDAMSGFWQIPLDNESAKLTAFISPFGRYVYHRFPQITSVPKIFQCTIEEIIAGEEHAVCFFVDILVFSENKEVHKKHLKNTMEKLNSAGIKLNKEQCQFR